MKKNLDLCYEGLKDFIGGQAETSAPVLAETSDAETWLLETSAEQSKNLQVL